jgi:phage terminase large subunit GpA-like protein
MSAAASPLLDVADAHFRAAEVERRAFRLFTPDPALSLRQWAEKYGRIDDGSTDGIPFRVSMVPYIGEPMDALSDPYCEEVAVKKCTQAGATVGLVLMFIAYFMDQDPARIMAIIPSVEEAEKWSKEKLSPMIDCTPRLRGRLGDDRAKQKDQQILRKTYPGGSLTIVGSNSGRGFRMVTMRAALGDDVDAWNATAGAAGDQVTLIRRRTDREPARKMLWVSSPEQQKTGRSRIDGLYQATQRRGRFHVPCPACGAYQVLRRGGPDEPYGLKWEKGRPETAEYLCEYCACLIPEKEKWAMVQRGRYLTAAGEPVRDGGRWRSYGFWFNAYSVVLAGSEWPRLAEEWIRVHRDPVERRSFVNTIDAELYTEENEEVTAAGLEARRETWQAEVPHGVGLLSMSVDVQDSWLEVAVWGWGAREESWLIYHERIHQDPEHQETPGRIEAIRTREWLHESGRKVRVWPCAIDGRNKGPQFVFPYVREKGRESREAVYAMLGYDQRAKQILHRALKPNKYGVRPWTVATISFKDVLFARLGLARQADKPVPPGYIHFPQPFPLGGDAEFLAQFGAEVRDEKRLGGRLVRTYRQIRKRNEAIDLYVLGLAALHTLGPEVLKSLELRAREWSEPAAEQPPEPAKPAPPPAPPPLPRRGGGGGGGSWATSW